MPPETMNDLFAFLTNLMTMHADMFQALGLNLFRALAIILIVWFGVKSALASASGGVGFQTVAPPVASVDRVWHQ